MTVTKAMWVFAS